MIRQERPQSADNSFISRITNSKKYKSEKILLAVSLQLAFIVSYSLNRFIQSIS